MKPTDPLITTEWLGARLEAPGIKIIDSSWRLPGEPSAVDDYAKRHIPGAHFFDIDAIADQDTTLPHMLPSPAQFAAAVGDMGVANSDHVVVYDDKGLFSAARLWWTFRMMGHQAVGVLSGGLPKWLAEGRPITDAFSASDPVDYIASPVAGGVAHAQDVRAAIKNRDAAILDARPVARFKAEASEPRPGLRAGHMPGALNLPFGNLIDENGELLPPDGIKDQFAQAGFDFGQRAITSCGSGVTAAILSLALEAAGHRVHRLYDGSWAEWGDQEHDESEFPVIGSK